MAVTIKDIAKVAGVSRGTVDRALNSRPGVNPEVAARVRQIAQDMGFEPSRAGRILALCKQNIKIGCLLPSLGNDFFDKVIAGIRAAEAELSDYNISVHIHCARGYTAKTHCDAIDALLADGCNALAICAVDMPEVQQKVDQLIDSGIPVITVNTDLTGSKRLCYCGCDYVAAGRTAGGMLALAVPDALKVLVVMGTKKHKGHNMRVQGFCSELERLKKPYTIVEILESEDNVKYGYYLTRNTLESGIDINAVYIAAAGVSGVCQAITDLNMQEYIHICAFDDIPSTKDLVEQGIVDFTICQEPYLQGYSCIQKLFQYFLSNKKDTLEDTITRSTIKIPANIRD
ncbi:MAG: LacI family DNA-binding transcriptional regulator [Treponemataceae bacterium]|nr:LacI family DNA-binding transcriptional regulator [Treponemataceae bacterium]